MATKPRGGGVKALLAGPLRKKPFLRLPLGALDSPCCKVYLCFSPILLEIKRGGDYYGIDYRGTGANNCSVYPPHIQPQTFNGCTKKTIDILYRKTKFLKVWLLYWKKWFKSHPRNPKKRFFFRFRILKSVSTRKCSLYLSCKLRPSLTKFLYTLTYIVHI